jgi:hypothetical protein
MNVKTAKTPSYRTKNSQVSQGQATPAESDRDENPTPELSPETIAQGMSVEELTEQVFDELSQKLTNKSKSAAGVADSHR